MKPVYHFCAAIAVAVGAAALIKCDAVSVKNVIDAVVYKTSGSVKVSETLVSRTIPSLDDFSSIEASRSVEVEYVVSDQRRAEMSVGENVADSLVCTVDGGVLKVYLKGRNTNYCSTEGRVNVKVFGPAALKSVKASTSAVVRMPDMNINGQLRLEASTSGDIEAGMVNAGAVALSASTSGDVRVKRVVATSLSAEASTSGDVKFDAFDGSTAELTAKTSGDVVINTVHAVNLTAEASTSGDVKCGTFDGTKANFTAKTSGDVKVDRLTATDLRADAATSGDIKVSGKVHVAELNASTSGTINVKGLEIDKPTTRVSTGGRVKG